MRPSVSVSAAASPRHPSGWRSRRSTRFLTRNDPTAGAGDGRPRPRSGRRLGPPRSRLLAAYTVVVYHGAVTAEYRTGDSKKTGAKSVRVSVSFDVTDYAAIKGIAKTKRVSAAWVVRDAVTNYLNAQVPLFASDRRSNA